MQIFIASVNQEGRTDADVRYLELRQKIVKQGIGVGHDPWTAEEKVKDLPSRGWRATIDVCVSALHGSDLMIILLYRRLGSEIRLDELGPSPVTFLEVELFHAALRRIPVLVFQAEDFVPDANLLAMITLLRRIIPAGQWFRKPERELEQAVLDQIRSLEGLNRLPSHLTGFCDALSDQRSFRKVSEEVESTRLSFLRLFAPGSADDVSLPRVDLCIADAEMLAGGSENAYVHRLSRLWLALRELAQCPETFRDPDIATRWIRLCELWAGTAAWLHLHGPLELSVLATLHTRAHLRSTGHLDERLFPFGAFASEAYSIAKISDRPQWQRRRLSAARALATRQIELNNGDVSGAYGVRASASMMLAQRGRPWLAITGLQDYRQLLSIREQRGASASEIGEAYVELGYAEFMLGRGLPWIRRSALERIRAGVDLLDGDHPEQRAGFVKRAKLKLIVALERSGASEEAAALRLARDAFSRDNGLPID